MKFGYMRSPTSVEEAGSHLADLEASGCGRIFVCAAGVLPSQDEVLAALLLRLGPSDTLIVTTFDSVAGSLSEFVDFVADLGRRGVVFESISEKFSTTETSGMISAASVFEQLSHFELSVTGNGRQSNGGPRPRAGRPRLLNQDDAIRAQMLVIDQGQSVKSVADEMGVSRATLYRYLDQSRLRPGRRGSFAQESGAPGSVTQDNHLDAGSRRTPSRRLPG